MSRPLLEVVDLCVGYGKVEAVHHVNLKMAPGQIVTVIGPNGAGKSSLLGAIQGMLAKSRGEVRFEGVDVSAVATEDLVGRGLTLVPERRELFSTLSVRDNLVLGHYCRRWEGRAALNRALDEMFALFPRLGERSGQEAGTLSGGERQMLALARALMGRPKLLMLDEPSLGLAPRIVGEIFQFVARLRDEGVSILLVEQNARAALKLADYGYVMESGEVSGEGPAAKLAADPRVIDSYLGSGATRG